MKRGKPVDIKCFYCKGTGYWWKSESDEEYQGPHCCIRCEGCGFRTYAAHGWGNHGDLSLGREDWEIGRGMKERLSTMIEHNKKLAEKRDELEKLALHSSHI